MLDEKEVQVMRLYRLLSVNTVGAGEERRIRYEGKQRN